MDDEFDIGDVLVKIDGREKWVVSDVISFFYRISLLPYLHESHYRSKKFVEKDFVKVGKWHFAREVEVDGND